METFCHLGVPLGDLVEERWPGPTVLVFSRSTLRSCGSWKVSHWRPTPTCLKNARASLDHRFDVDHGAAIELLRSQALDADVAERGQHGLER